MEFVKEWCTCVCASLIVAVIFSLFTPKGSMKGFYKILISFFVFISFIYPLKNADFSGFDIDKSIISESENNASPYAEMINTEVKNTLKNKGISGVSVSSDVGVDYAAGEVDIKSVTVFVSDGYDKNNVRKIIFDSLGINAEVKGIGE